MKTQLIGFDFGLNPNYKLELFKEIVNGSDADLILFPGHTLRDFDDLYYLESELTNNKSTVALELIHHQATSCLYLHNALFLLREGAIVDLCTSQVFAKADEIKGDEVLMSKLLDEIPRRQFECGGKRITVLQCGETALLSSSKAEGYKAGFRYRDNARLNERYEEMLTSTDIFLNPIHTPQGEQGIMAQRRATLSADGRYYLSTCSLSEDMPGKLKSKSLQYVWNNGQELLIKPEIHKDEGYVSRMVEI